MTLFFTFPFSATKFYDAIKIDSGQDSLNSSQPCYSKLNICGRTISPQQVCLALLCLLKSIQVNPLPANEKFNLATILFMEISNDYIVPHVSNIKVISMNFIFTAFHS